jgi:hypothetical protein
MDDAALSAAFVALDQADREMAAARESMRAANHRFKVAAGHFRYGTCDCPQVRSIVVNGLHVWECPHCGRRWFPGEERLPHPIQKGGM